MVSSMIGPHRVPVAAGRHGLLALIHAEWTKFRTVRGWTIGAAAAVVVALFISLLGPLGSHTSIAGGGRPGGPVTGPGGEAVQESFYFVHQPLQGNGSITVRVSSLTGGVALRPNRGLQAGLQPWAKAGLILVQTTKQGSPYAAVMVTGSHGVRMQYDYTHDAHYATAALTVAVTLLRRRDA